MDDGAYLHAYVATPAYDGKVDCDYSQSLAESCQAATVFGVRVTAAVMGNSCFIDLARNMFVRIFLEDEAHKDCTHLFFIDSDLKFEPRAFVSLMRANLPICAGIYRRRQEEEDYPLRWIPHEEETKKLGRKALWFENGFLQCDRVPTGFLCISREVLQEMADDAPKVKVKEQPPIPRLFYTKIDEDGRFVGEDYAFCDDYMERYGQPIPVWPDFDFVHGGYECNYSKWLSDQVEESRKEFEAKGTRGIGKRKKKVA